MKLAFFDDFKLGVVKGDSIVDVSSVVRDIPHTGPGNLISGLIERFADYRGKLEDAVASAQRRAAVQRAHPSAAAEAGQHRLHGGELHGERHAAEAGADQRVPQGAHRDHRPRRHHGAARRAGDDLRGRGGTRAGHRQARHQGCRGHAMDYIFGYVNFIDGSARGLPPPGNVFFQMKSRDTFAPIGPYLVTKDEIADPQKLPIKLMGQRRAEAGLQHQRHGAQHPALHRVGDVDPHAGAGRHPGHRHQPSRPVVASWTATRSSWKCTASASWRSTCATS